jgi:argininosuccinate lyase
LTDEQFASVHPQLTKDVRSVLTTEGALTARITKGASSPAAFAEQIKVLKKEHADAARLIASKSKAFSEMMGQ